MGSQLSIQPTPVRQAPTVSRAIDCDVWVKCEDQTHAVYGGNKARKLAPLLDEALRRRVTDLVTVGAVGSNHVLATAVHGRRAGLGTHAVVVPHPRTSDAEAALQRSLDEGCSLTVSREILAAARLAGIVARLRGSGRRPMLIPPGGTSPLGTLAYAAALFELEAQCRAGELTAWPDAMFCVLGSGGTLAGLLAGARCSRRSTQLVGVVARAGLAVSRPALTLMARDAERRWRRAHARAAAHVDAPFSIDRAQLGAGYGHPTAAAQRALELFAEDGILLDLTYTAKAAAALLAYGERQPGSRLLLWNSFAAAAPGAAATESAGPKEHPAWRALV